MITDLFGNKTSSITTNNTVLITAQEFHDVVNISAYIGNYTCYGNVLIADKGDILKVIGKINEMSVKYDEYIGEYTSIVLYTPDGLGLAVYSLGNVTDKYNIGSYVELILHVIYCQGIYKDIYGRTWTLSGEFMAEEFIDDKFAFELIMPQNQMKIV